MPIGLLLSLLLCDAYPLSVGDTLTKQEGLDARETLLCSPQYCVWHVSQYLGGCSEERCSQDYLVVTDRKSVVLSQAEQLPFDPQGKVWFEAPDTFTVVTPKPFLQHNPGGAPWDVGIDTTELFTRRVRIRNGGKSLAIDKEVSVPGYSQSEVRSRVAALLGPKRQQAAPGISPADAERARGKCNAGREPDSPYGPFELESSYCGSGTCLALLSAPYLPKPSRESVGCAVLVDGSGVRFESLAADKTVSEEGNTIVLVDPQGGIRGGPGNEYRLLRSDPAHMAFISPAGLTLAGANPYPVLPQEGAGPWPASPVILAATPWHVTWGADSWTGPEDLALRWQAARVGPALAIRAQVTDDVVVPLGKGKALASDHLELSWSTWNPQRREIRIAALLGAGGSVELRVWRRLQPSSPNAVEVDEPFAGSGRWSLTPHGYDLSLSIPKERLDAELANTRDAMFSITVSDSDGERQQTLIGSRGKLPEWSRYPPSTSDYAASVPAD